VSEVLEDANHLDDYGDLQVARVIGLHGRQQELALAVAQQLVEDQDPSLHLRDILEELLVPREEPDELKHLEDVLRFRGVQSGLVAQPLAEDQEEHLTEVLVAKLVGLRVALDELLDGGRLLLRSLWLGWPLEESQERAHRFANFLILLES